MRSWVTAVPPFARRLQPLRRPTWSLGNPVETMCYEAALLMLNEAGWLVAIGPVARVEHANDGLQASVVLGGV